MDAVKRFILAIFVVLAAAPLLAQSSKESLASLIEAGNRKAALERIRAGADVNEAQPDGTRPIHWAVYRVDYELLEALIAKKANVNVRNEFGSTPIARSRRTGRRRMVKMLLDAGAEAEGANPDGQTALMLAIKTGECAVVEMLIKAGANVNTIEKFHNQTPLMWAAAAPRNAGAMVKLLLAKGADVKPRALYTDWPSQITSEPRAQYRPVGGLTALLYAARDGCYDCVEALIAAGADVNLPTPEGVTPLMLALDNDHNDVAKLLLDRGANPQLWDWWGRTALYIAIDRKETRGGGQRTGAAERAWRCSCRRSRFASGGFEHGYHQRLARRRCRSQSAAQYASPEPRRKQRTLHRSPAEYRMHAVAARHHGRRCRSGSSPSGQGRQSQHQRHGPYAVPGRGWSRTPATAAERALPHRPAPAAR